MFLLRIVQPSIWKGKGERNEYRGVLLKNFVFFDNFAYECYEKVDYLSRSKISDETKRISKYHVREEKLVSETRKNMR